MCVVFTHMDPTNDGSKTFEQQSVSVLSTDRLPFCDIIPLPSIYTAAMVY